MKVAKKEMLAGTIIIESAGSRQREKGPLQLAGARRRWKQWLLVGFYWLDCGHLVKSPEKEKGEKGGRDIVDSPECGDGPVLERR